MKFLIWLRANINLVSVLTGIGFIVAGKADVGQQIIAAGGQF